MVNFFKKKIFMLNQHLKFIDFQDAEHAHMHFEHYILDAHMLKVAKVPVMTWPFANLHSKDQNY